MKHKSLNVLPAFVLSLALASGCHPAPQVNTREIALPAKSPTRGKQHSPAHVSPDAPQTNTLRLLDGRWIARFPPGAVVRQRVHDVMSAPHAMADETRVVLDAGDERLVVMAMEQYRAASSNLLADVRADVAGDLGSAPNATLTPLSLAATGVRAIVVAWHPSQPGSPNAGTEVTRSFLASADGTVQTVDTYVNENAFHSDCAALANASSLPRDAGCLAVSLAMARTLRPGDRPLLNLHGGMQRLPHVPLTATLPPGWVSSAQVGDDFSVVHLNEIVPMGHARNTLNVYVGEHPQDLTEGDATRTMTGRLFGQPIPWHLTGSNDGGGSTFMECQQPLRAFPHATVHVFANAPDRATEARLQAIAETLAVIPPG